MSYRDNPFVYVTAENGKVVHIPLSDYVKWEKEGTPIPAHYFEDEPLSYDFGSFVYVTGDDGHVTQIPVEKVEDWEKKHKLA